ncbi:unannotated protein [freshwater metagenome]|uniref:Unannotated protein n=1 Tax=freshwater metagenome TaxID=449393 RepID=A0A6J7DRF4_9ZZZZ
MLVISDDICEVGCQSCDGVLVQDVRTGCYWGIQKQLRAVGSAVTKHDWSLWAQVQVIQRHA